MTTHPYTRLFPGNATSPTVNDDSGDGYEVGDIWIDETGGAAYHAVDVTVGAAVWLELGAGSGFPNPFALPADITPAALSADQNNYNPTGLATADVLRLESSGTPRNITGLAGGADGRIILIRNIGATYNVVLKNESASSDADKRFALGGNDVSVGPGQGVILQYDATLSRWYATATQDHTKLANIGNYSHTQVDSHIDSGHLAFQDSEGDPAAIGTAADGTSDYAARRDHVHAMGTLTGRHWLPFGVYSAINPITATGQVVYSATIDRTMTLIKWSQAVYVTTTNDGSNYWKLQLVRWPDSVAVDEINTSGASPDTATLLTDTAFDISSVGASDVGLYVYPIKVGSPGNLYIFGPALEVSI